MKITKFKFFFSQFSFFNFFNSVIKFLINKKNFLNLLNKIDKTKNSKDDKVILSPLIESSHYVNILLLILLKYLERRGYKIVILLCDQSLDACEIKNCFTENSKFVCSKCKFNRTFFINIFKFETILLSEFNYLKPTKILPIYKDFQIDENFEYQNKKIHQPILDSVYRFFYGNYDENDSKFKEIYYKNLFAYIWMSRISIYIDKKYKIKKVLGFMTAYSSWHPIFEYFKLNGNRFLSFSLTQFDIHGITINYHDLYPAKERYLIFKSKRNTKYLLDKERKLLLDFMNKRFKNKSDIFVKDKYFDDNRNINYFLKIEQSKKNIFLFSNVFWDIGVSECGYVYDNVIDWIIDTINILKDKSDINLYIKPHPAEISEGTQSLSGIENIIKSKIENIPKNVFFIEPEWKLNTYDLFKFIDIGLIFNGTIGLEMLSNDVPVISVGKTPSFELNLMYEPNSKNEYYELLNSNLSTFHDKQELEIFMFFYFIKCSYPWVLTKKAYGYSIKDLLNEVNTEDKKNKKSYYLNYLLDYIENKNIYIDNWKT